MRLFFLVVLLLFFGVNTSSAQSDSAKVNYSFVNAADRGDVKSVIRFILKGVNLDFRDANGATALFYATNNAHMEVIKTLLYYGADPNIGTYDGFTPLMNAALQGEFDVAQLLLYDVKTNLDIHDINNCTALHYASYYDNIYIVDMLLYYGANAQLKAKYQTSPLFLASFTGDTALTQLLINSGNLIKLRNAKGYSPMSIAIQNDDSVLFNFYFEKLKEGKTEDDDWNHFLASAIKHENGYATKKLMDFFQKGVFELKEGDDLLKEAYRLENYNLVAEFKKHGYSASWMPIVNSFQFRFSESFNAEDFTSFFKFGFDEVRYNVSASFVYGTRFKKKAIRKEIDDNTFYQYWERRNIVGFQLRKNFLYIPAKELIIKPYIGAEFQWHFVDYNGISQNEPTSFVFVPELGISFKYQMLLIDFAYQYSDFGIYEVSPHRINIGVGINIPFYQKSKKYYPLWL
jgi:ankyrin repeat protein